VGFSNTSVGLALPLCGLILSCATVPAEAADGRPFTATVAVGTQYDSNVSIEEADINLRRGDPGILFSATASYTPVAETQGTIRLGYSYDAIFNQDLHEFDLEIHTLTASGSYKFGKVQVGLDYRYNNVQLGRAPYLVMHSASPSVSAFVTPRLFIRAAYTGTDRQFTTFDKLDGTSQTLAIDAYRFTGRRRGYLAVGLRRDVEDTTAREFRFDGWQVSARAQVPVKLGRTRLKARLAYTFGERHYSDVTPSIGIRREERRSTWTGGVDLGITGNLTLKPQLRLTDRDSNVRVYDYRETVVSTVLSLKLR